MTSRIPFALRPIALCVIGAWCELAMGNPNGPAVAAGAASFQNTAKALTVTNTPGTIINWQGFSIGGGETTRFVQQSASSAVLNRVIGPDPSSLLGSLTSNGRVFLINTNGIIVGAGARIDTAGFIASTLNITDSDFLQGRLRFEGGGNGALRNAGTIRASGDIMLVGPSIENSGIIRSDNGAVLLAAGRKLTITSPDAQGVRFELQSPSDSALNVGTLDARTAATMFAGTLRHSGDIRVGAATVDAGGRVTLVAQKDAVLDKSSTITASGTRGGDVTVRAGELAWVEGTIDATGSAGAGGTVQLLGEHVGVSGAKVDVSGSSGGGTILVGGDYRGGNPDIPNAKATFVSADSKLDADALASGDGGRIIVWADDTTRVHGSISARGGEQSGNGGFVETSGHYLEVTRPVDVSSPRGARGQWLLDPGEVTIVQGPASADQKVTPASPFTPVPENSSSVLTTGTINSALVGADVTISTGTAPGGASGDIIFDASPSAGGNLTIDKVATGMGSLLRLDAAHDIRFRNGATAFQTSGPGNPQLNVEMRPGLGGAGGAVVTEAGATASMVRVDGTGNVSINLMNGAAWQNSGTVNVTPGTSVRLFDEANFASFTNQPGSTLNVSAAGGTAFRSDPANPAGVVQNAGSMTVSSNSAIEAAFTNSGQLDVNASTLTLHNAQTIGGTVTFSGAASLSLPRTTGAGALFADTTFAGSGLVLLQGASPGDTIATFRGVSAPGVALRIALGGTALVEPSLTAAALTTLASVQLAGGDLGGSGALTATSLAWLGGSILGLGAKTFTSSVFSSDSQSTPRLAGSVALGADGSWTNSGQLAHDGAGQLTIGSGAVVTNQAGANWNISSSSAAPIVGAGTFNNAGVLTSSGLNAHAVTASLRNTGVIVVADNNALALGPGGAAPDSGTISLGDHSTITFAGDRTLGGASSISDAGGTVQVSGGTLNAFGAINGGGALSFTGGTANFLGGALAASTISASGGDANFNVPIAASAAVTIDGGTLNFNAASSASSTLALSSGAIGGSGPLDVSGALTWTGGAMTGSGVTNANGGLAVSGSAGKALVSGRTLSIPAGTIATWSGSGNIDATGGSTINNAGTWQDQSSGAIVSVPGGGTFANNGAYVKSGGNSTIGVAFQNTGGAASVDVQSGAVLRLAGGGASSRPFTVNGTLTFASDYSISADIAGSGDVSFVAGTTAVAAGNYNVGSTLVAGGNATFSAPVHATGIGALSITAGTLTLNSGAPVAVPSLVLAGGALAGSDDVTVSGATTWSGGTMTGTGATVTGGGAVIGGSTLKTLAGGRTFRTPAAAATTVTATGTLQLSSGASIANQGIWNDQSGGLLIADAGGAGAFANTGTYAHTASNGITSIAVPFNNNGGGSVSVQSGRLRLAGGGSGDRPYTVGDLATLEFAGGAYTLSGGADVSGPGAVRISGGTVAFNGGAYNVTGGTSGVGGNASFSAAENVIATGPLLVSGGSLDLSSGESIAAPALTISGGTLRGSDTINVAGAMTWSGGTMSGSGVTNSNGSLSIVGAGVKNLDGGRVLNNNGTADWTNGTTPVAGAISTGNGARINNAGTWKDATTGAVIDHALGGAASPFTNTGTYVKAAAGTTTIDTGVSFDNSGSGQVQVQSGTLTTRGGGTEAGSFSVGSSAVLDFNLGSYSFTPGAAVNGGGTLRVSGATLDVATALVTDTPVQLTAGTIAASQPLTLNGAFGWSGGTVTGSGKLVTSGPTTISGTATLTNTTWDNFGTVAIGGTSMLGLDGDGGVPVTVNNRAGGVFDVTSFSTAPIAAISTAANKRFNNAGTLNLSTAPNAFIGPAVTNTGTMNVNGGHLTIDSFPANAGTLNIAQGATLATGGASLTNTGTIAGGGTLDLAGAALNNAGTLRPEGATGVKTGTLSIVGDLAEGAGASIDLDLAGTAPGAFDRLVVSGNAALAGTVNVTALPSYTPAVGDVFPVISSASRTGNFSTVNKSFATNMTASYSGSGLTFTIGGGPVNSWISTSGDWSIGGNWSLGHVPTASETALVDQPGTLTITVPLGTYAPDALTSNENITINGGTLSLASASTINAAFAINGGTLAGRGLLTVNGPTTVTGASQIAGRLNASSLALPSGSLAVTSTGSLQLNAAGRTDMTAGKFDNAGAVTVGAGTLALGNGQDSGVYDIAAASALELAAGTRDLNSDVVFRGSGALRMTGSIVNVNSMLTQSSDSPALELSAGSVNNIAGIALNGRFAWSGGTVSGPAVLTTGSTAATTVSGTATLANSTWNNFGRLDLTGDGRIVLASNGANSVLTNRSGGTLDDMTTAATPIGFAGTRATTRFNNSGAFIKSAGSASTQTLDVPMTNTRASAPLDGDGIIVASGTVVANGLSTNAGTIDIREGAALSTGGNALTNASQGLLKGNGTLVLGGAAFTNSGTVAPGESPGTLTISGDYVQTAAGRLDIQITDTAHDLLKISGNAALDGTLAIEASPNVPVGTSNQIITYASRTGDFSTKTSTAGVTFQSAPGATSYEVVRTSAQNDTSSAKMAAQELGTDAVLIRDPNLPRSDRRDDPRDPRDPNEQRRRVLPECR